MKIFSIFLATFSMAILNCCGNQKQTFGSFLLTVGNTEIGSLISFEKANQESDYQFILNSKLPINQYGEAGKTRAVIVSNRKIICADSAKAHNTFLNVDSPFTDKYFSSVLSDTVFRIPVPYSFNDPEIQGRISIIFVYATKQGLIGIYRQDDSDLIKEKFKHVVLSGFKGNCLLNEVDTSKYLIYQKQDAQSIQL
jgi:hypothetical protein